MVTCTSQCEKQPVCELLFASLSVFRRNGGRALATLFAFALQAAPPPVPELFYYKFDETGTSATNYASSPPPGTATATILGGITQNATIPFTVVKGIVGTGVTSTTDYVNTGWATNLSGSWTISFASIQRPGSSRASGRVRPRAARGRSSLARARDRRATRRYTLGRNRLAASRRFVVRVVRPVRTTRP